MGDELKRLEEQNAELARELAERADALQAAQRDFDHFAYSVSHDLRAPLRHITAFSAMLERMALSKLDEAERSTVQAIKEAADRMNQLIDDLLRLSRAGRAELHHAPVPLQEVVRQAHTDLAPEALSRKIEWRIQPLPTVDADPTLLRQAFVALLSNALKFTRPRETVTRIPSRIRFSSSSNSRGRLTEISACLRFTELSSTVTLNPSRAHSPRP